MNADYSCIQYRNVLDIIQDSVEDLPMKEKYSSVMKNCNDSESGMTNHEVRYKLIIDSSEDDSAVRLLLAYGILDRVNTRMFVCSEFPEESKMHVSMIGIWVLLLFLITCIDQYNSWD